VTAKCLLSFRGSSMTATNHDDQLGEIYPPMLNELNYTFGISFSRFHCCGHHGHGLWPSWYVTVMVVATHLLAYTTDPEDSASGLGHLLVDRWCHYKADSLLWNECTISLIVVNHAVSDNYDVVVYYIFTPRALRS